MFGNTIVIKTLKSFDGRSLTDKHMKLIEQGLSIMALLRDHKNIAKMVAFCREDNYYILMKYYRVGSLDKFLRNASNHISKQLILSFTSNICSGLQALHQNGLAHSDIKGANVLIDVDDDGYAFCVLTDFGITQVLSLSHVVSGFNITNITGLSKAYGSPEAFARKSSKRGFTDKPAVFKAGDIYSVGAVVFELMTRKCPWS
jgi:serine/threonine protein kinase